ncbi:MAG: VOC family protein, partial [Verrucomicrobia bacterium]|nr:VOC family protein [Verrucomicrobiota bacterium]
MKIDALDHLVLTVQNIEQTVHFYTTTLGMTRQNFCGACVS